MAGAACLSAQTAAGPAPAPWLRDLEAARLLETSSLLSPAKDASELAARSERIDTLYRDLAARYPTRAAVQQACGDYAWRRHRTDEAIGLLLHAQSLEPGDAETADLLGTAYLQLGRMREAGGQFQRAVKAGPDDPRYHFDLANVLYLFRNELIDPPAVPDAAAALARSLEEFRLSASLAPRDLRYAKAYAETFYAFPRPDWEQALTAWENVLDLSGPDTDFANSHLARISLRLKRPEEVERYLARIHGPKFDALKAKFQTDASRMPRATPPASP